MRARKFLVSWISFLVIATLVLVDMPAIAAAPDGTPGSSGGGSGGSILVEGLTGVRSVAADGNLFVALHGDGTVSTFRSINEKGIPAKKKVNSSAHRIMGVTAGGGFIFSLATDGTVWSSRQDAPEQPAVPVSGLKDIKAVSAGPDYLYALSAGGLVSYHAINTKGTGTGGRTLPPAPVRWMAPGRNSVLLGMGDGAVRHITFNAAGEPNAVELKALAGSPTAALPTGDQDCDGTAHAFVPGAGIISARLAGPIADVDRDGWPDLRGGIKVATGCSHGVVLKADGTVWQLRVAINEAGVQRSATQQPDIRNAVAIAAGRNFDAAVMGDGSVRVWRAPTVARKIPGLANATKVVTGGGRTVALMADGTMAEFAINEQGVHRAVPIPNAADVIDCVMAGNFLLLLKADGTVLQVLFNPKEYSVTAVAGLSGVAGLTGGGTYALARLHNGTVAHIAIDASGAHLTDAKIDLQNVASVSGGPDTFLALTAAGKGWDGSVKGNSITVAPASGVIAAREAGSGMATGRRQHAALMGDGSVRIIDINEKGEASTRVWGDPHVDQQDGFAAVSLGTTQMALLKGDGTVWICPIASSEAGVQIADTAVLLSGVRLAVAVTVGDTYAYALTAEGTVWFWAV